MVLRIGYFSSKGSLALAICGLVIVVTAMYWESLRGIGSSRYLEFVDSLGLVKNPPAGNARIDSIGPAGLISFNDQRLFLVLLVYGLYLSVLGTVSSLRLEYARESDQYSSIAFVVGALTFVYWSTPCGLLVFCLGALVHTLAKRLKGV
jgi:hypothetical protein